MKQLMQKIRDNPTTTTRQRAEAMVHASPADVTTLTQDDVHRLVFELQVHHIELQLQNEELRATQLELASSRDRYADLYEFAPVGYLTVNRAGIILEANLTAAAMLGTSRGMLPNSRFSYYVAPHSQDAVHLYWQRIFSTGERHVTEVELQYSDGVPMTVRLEGIIFPNALDSAPQCRLALIDTSDLKLARDLLTAMNIELESRIAAQVNKIKLMANAISNLGEGVMISNDHADWKNSQISFANAALCHMTGYTTAELIGQSPRLLLSNKVEPGVLVRLNAALATAQPFQGELNYQTKEGSHRDIELHISPLYDADNDTGHLVTIQRDVTARNQAQKALKDREQRLAAVLDAAGDAIIAFDQTGIIRDCNPAFERIFGYAAADVMGKNIGLLIPVSQQQSDSYWFRNIGSSREAAALHVKGHSFPVAVTVSQIDHLQLYMAVVHDISELRKLQKEVLLSAGKVQWAIGQALHDGPQQGLAGLSLLARGLSQDLARESSAYTAEAAKLADGLQRENRVIRSLARGLVPVQIGESGLMQSLEELARIIADESDVQCNFECPEPIQIEDTFKEEQLFLIAQEATLNAVKHADTDSVRICLRCGEDAISVRVVDHGCGLDQTEAIGRGLGLHIMPHRAAAIGATLTISNRAEGGTVVECTLPR